MPKSIVELVNFCEMPNFRHQDIGNSKDSSSVLPEWTANKAKSNVEGNLKIEPFVVVRRDTSWVDPWGGHFVDLVAIERTLGGSGVHLVCSLCVWMWVGPVELGWI